MKMWHPWCCTAAGLALLTAAACKSDKVSADADNSTAPASSPSASSSATAGPAAGTGAVSTAAANASGSAATANGSAVANSTPPGKPTGPAYEHLPNDCDVVAQLDIKALLEQTTVKKVLVPQLRTGFDKPPKTDSEKRMRAFLGHSGIDPLRDVHSLALCVQGAASNKPQFVAALGGQFKSNNIIAEALIADNSTPFKRDSIDGRAVGVRGKENVVGQASDAVVLMANSRAIFQAALGTSNAASTAGLPLAPAFAMVISGKAVREAAKNKAQGHAFQVHLEKVQRLEATVDTTNNKLQVRVGMPDKAAAAALQVALKNALKGAGQMQGPLANFKDAGITVRGKDLLLAVTLEDERLRGILELAIANALRTR